MTSTSTTTTSPTIMTTTATTPSTTPTTTTSNSITTNTTNTQTINMNKTTTSSKMTQYIILFYKFHPLSSQKDIVELYRSALERLCQSLQLKGRILVGCNIHQSEGINGTLSSDDWNKIHAFTRALTKTKQQQQQEQKNDTSNSNENDNDNNDDNVILPILEQFWNECDHFYQMANCEPLVMEDSEFKWSTTTTTTTATATEKKKKNNNDDDDGASLFPDLNIKIVKELIGTGGVLAPIPLSDVHQGYLTPKEWHERISQLVQNSNKNNDTNNNNNNDTILIDCRNTKEYQIGHFPNAIDPKTTTFNQFPKWVQEHSASLANKKVLMYCTGGIRCEKASAYIRQQVPSVQEVRHLKGGIHKYLDEYGNNNNNNNKQQLQEGNLWQGKNFVFDGRVAQAVDNDNSTATTSNNPKDDIIMSEAATSTATTKNSTTSTSIVGSCKYCSVPYDSFDPGCVCTVCREPILVCTDCRRQSLPSSLSSSNHNHYHLQEFHCYDHDHLKTCYFTNLEQFTDCTELQRQYEELQTIISEIAIGKKFKQKRKTLYKQCDKVLLRIEELKQQQGQGQGQGQGQEQEGQQGVDDKLGTIVGGETTITDTTAAAAASSSTTNATTIAISMEEATKDDKEDPVSMKIYPANASKIADHQVELKCRNCGEIGCSGRCWGFHGLKRKRVLEEASKKHDRHNNGTTDTASIANSSVQSKTSSSAVSMMKRMNNKKNNIHLQEQKEREKQEMILDLKQLQLAQPPLVHRNVETGIRVPIPCTRTLQSNTKGKWCGMPLLKVLQEEFSELSSSSSTSSSSNNKNGTSEYLIQVMERGLLRVNKEKITTLERAENLRLKNMDVISRIVHWHEPPVHIPSNHIGVQKIPLPKALCDEYNIPYNDHTTSTATSTATTEDTSAAAAAAADSNLIFVCDKPSSVPVHPAGPYLSNSMTIMVEAQEGLEPRSLIPCHRIDRVTSGLTLCCTNVKVARLVQGRIDEGSVQKQYLARVIGKFPESPSPSSSSKEEQDVKNLFPTSLPSESDNSVASWRWYQDPTKIIAEGTGETASATTATDAAIDVDVDVGVDSVPTRPMVLVNGPIETVDPANGIRKITSKGKPSQSLFQFLSYDPKSDTSIISCTPLTGRSHQLRVHLQYLGYPIVNDVLYGGETKETGTTTTTAAVAELLSSIQKVMSTNEDHSNTNGDINGNNNDLKSASLSFEDVRAAKEICPCCKAATTTAPTSSTPTAAATASSDESNKIDAGTATTTITTTTTTTNSEGLSTVFTPAQLLQGGHEICLHAYRYRIPFMTKKKKMKPIKEMVAGHSKNTDDTSTSLSGGDNTMQKNISSSSPVAVLDFQVGLPVWVSPSAVTNLDWPSISKKDMEV